MLYLSVQQVASRYGLSPWTIRAKARNGQLPHLRHSGAKSFLFPLEWLDAFDEGAPLEVVRTRAPRRGVPAARVVRPRIESPA
jgi:excisionase family DNA binding protein